MRVTVKRILKMKGSYVPTVVPEARISELVDSLETEDVGALIVSADGQHIDGIISERNVVRGLRRFGLEVLEHTVRDFMISDIVTCTPDDRVAGVMALMDDRKLLCIPVIEEGKFVGIVSIQDISKLRLVEVQSEADAMRAYITG